VRPVTKARRNHPLHIFGGGVGKNLTGLTEFGQQPGKPLFMRVSALSQNLTFF
jgi:hypothetical protein